MLTCCANSCSSLLPIMVDKFITHLGPTNAMSNIAASYLHHYSSSFTSFLPKTIQIGPALCAKVCLSKHKGGMCSGNLIMYSVNNKATVHGNIIIANLCPGHLCIPWEKTVNAYSSSYNCFDRLFDMRSKSKLLGSFQTLAFKLNGICARATVLPRGMMKLLPLSSSSAKSLQVVRKPPMECAVSRNASIHSRFKVMHDSLRCWYDGFDTKVFDSSIHVCCCVDVARSWSIK